MHARYCTHCGAALAHESAGNGAACAGCGRMHYRNPAVRVACIALRAGEASAALWHTALGEGEAIQAAALRALGTADATPAREDRLVLYATVTDEGSERLFVVFRLQDGALRDALAQPGDPPVWSAALLERFAAEARAGRFAVYTGNLAGATLHLHAVADDR